MFFETKDSFVWWLGDLNLKKKKIKKQSQVGWQILITKTVLTT